MKSTHLPQERWQALERLFDTLLESETPDDFIAAVHDAEIRAELLRLWEEHKCLADSDFLLSPPAGLLELAESELRFFPGQILCSRFVIERLLGAGGMGEIYLAFDERLEEQVAVKTMSPDLAEHAELRRRFVSEVQNARRVTHPNVCRIFELFDEDETLFFVMEYLRGPTLAEWLQTSRHSLAVRRKVAIDIAEGLAAAHSNGVIHRDLKPANVIVIGPETRLKAVITDFGLARIFHEKDRIEPYSVQAGTLEYMAPELLQGVPASYASDLYAFGRILAQLLPGDRFGAACLAARPDQRPVSLSKAIHRWKSQPTRRRLIAAFAVAVPAAAIATYRYLAHPRTILGSPQRVALSAFHPQTDTTASLVRSLLITGLQQSPLLTVVTDERLHALIDSGKERQTLPPSLSKILPIAEKARIAFVIEGNVQWAGRQLMLAVGVYDSATGQRILEETDSADRNGFVRLADRVSLRLRRSFGESEESLHATYKDLNEVRSAIPEAVQAFYQGVQIYEGADALRSLVWFDRAIELDPQFALAHLYRGICLAADGDAERAFPSYVRAYELRFRVAERERLWIESRYANITEDRLKAVETLRHLVQLYPEEAVFQRHLGFAYAHTQRPLDALEHDRKAIELDPSSVNNRNVLLCDLVQAGRFDEALANFREFREQGIKSPMLELGAALAWMGKGDYPQSQSCLDRMTVNEELDREARLPRSGLLILEGRFRDAASLLESDLAYAEAVSEGVPRETFRARLGFVHWLMDHQGQARELAADISHLPSSSPIWLRGLHDGGLLAYLAGDLATLTEIFSKLRAIEHDWPSTRTRGIRAHIEALVKTASNDPGAEDLFLQARGLWPDPLVLFSLAQFQARKRDYSAALSTLDTLDGLRGDIFRNYFTGIVVLSWLERARCLRSLSRNAESLRYLRQVLNHWERHAGSYSVVRMARRDYIELTRLNS
jgi:serine/threonine protein kinase/Tfp pilus assembly protein PilF